MFWFYSDYAMVNNNQKNYVSLADSDKRFISIPVGLFSSLFVQEGKNVKKWLFGLAGGVSTLLRVNKEWQAVKKLGSYGCFFFCHLWMAQTLLGRPFRASSYFQARDENFINTDCTVKDSVGLLYWLTGKLFHTSVGTVSKNMKHDFIVSEWSVPGTQRKHFTIEEGYGSSFREKHNINNLQKFDSWIFLKNNNSGWVLLGYRYYDYE